MEMASPVNSISKSVGESGNGTCSSGTLTLERVGDKLRKQYLRPRVRLGRKMMQSRLMEMIGK